MSIAASLRRSLESLGRRTKFGILMLAAWAPVVFPRHPFLAALVLSLASGIFLMATRRDRALAMADSTPSETP